MDIEQEFEKWLRTVCFQPQTKDAYDLAKQAFPVDAEVMREKAAREVVYGEWEAPKGDGCYVD